MTGDLHLTITLDDVRAWVRRRSELYGEIAELDNRLAAVRVLMPAIANMLGSVDIVSPSQPDAEPVAFQDRPMTDLVLWALRDEKSGRDTRWIRTRLSEIPELQPRIDGSPNSVSNATSRLTGRGLLIKDRGLYYLPDLYKKIQTGEVVEDRSTDDGHGSFNRMMQELVASHGKPFVAADAVALAKDHPILKSIVEDNVSKVYSWLGRQTFNKRLRKVGDFYALPGQENEASKLIDLDASDAGEAATSSKSNQGSIDDLLG